MNKQKPTRNTNIDDSINAQNFMDKKFEEIIQRNNDEEILKVCESLAIMDGSIKSTPRERNKAFAYLRKKFFESEESNDEERKREEQKNKRKAMGRKSKSLYK